jgi:hypothetical protein
VRAPEFALGEAVRVGVAGTIIGRTEYLDGVEHSYLVQYTNKRGRITREWVTGDKLERN